MSPGVGAAGPGKSRACATSDWLCHLGCLFEPQFSPFAKLISKYSLVSESPGVFATDNFQIYLFSPDLSTKPLHDTAFFKISTRLPPEYFQLSTSETKLLVSLHSPNCVPPISVNGNSIYLIAQARISVVMLEFSFSHTPHPIH